MARSIENRMKKKILVKALSTNLEKMSKSADVRSLKEGKELICPYCDMPVQPCKSDPSLVCERMIRGGTEGKQIEDALKDYNENKYGICVSCGKRISIAQLKKHPTAELCPQCTRKGRRVSARKLAHT